MDTETVIYGLIFAVANPWAIFEFLRVANARRERVRLAREEIVDILESHLVTRNSLPPSMLHEVSMALSLKRRVPNEEIYRPIKTLHELLLRVRSNPAMDTTVRRGLESRIEFAVSNLKRAEGVQLLDNATDAVTRAGSFSERTRARELLTQLAENWGTFEDQAAMAHLRHLRTRLGSGSQRTSATQVLADLRSRWAAVPPGISISQFSDA